MNGLACGCGAFSTTLAGFQQMDPRDRATFQRQIATCATCKRDRQRQGARRT